MMTRPCTEVASGFAASGSLTASSVRAATKPISAHLAALVRGHWHLESLRPFDPVIAAQAQLRVVGRYCGTTSANNPSNGCRAASAADRER
jgi:hypothetical protein